MKYIIPALLFLANSEIISLLALLIITGCFAFDLVTERGRYRESNS